MDRDVGSQQAAQAALHACAQELMDGTYSKTWTHDRRRRTAEAAEKEAVPSGFRVLSVDVVAFNPDLVKAYVLARRKIRDSMAGENIDWYTPRTSRWDSGRFAHRNDWLLLHGTSPAGAAAIKERGFSVAHAKPTGSCGPLLYFAESSTKADEYTSAAPGGSRQIVVCGVIGGKVFYTEDAQPDKGALASAIRKGTYHSVLNNREAARGTYKEFAVLDPNQVRPWCVIHYERLW